MDRYRDKLKTFAELKPLLEGHRGRQERVVLANGCFDMLHVGHIRYLQAARAAGDVLVVAINNDESVRNYKGKGRPLMPVDERAEVLSELSCIDYLVLFSEEGVGRVLAELRPDIHAKGTDYTVETVPEREIARSLGIETVIVGDPKDHSTTDLIRRILARQ